MKNKAIEMGRERHRTIGNVDQHFDGRFRVRVEFEERFSRIHFNATEKKRHG